MKIVKIRLKICRHFRNNLEFIWDRKLDTFVKICWETPFLLKSSKSIARFTWRPKYASVYPATLYRHIHALSSREAESDCLCSRRGRNIMRTRHSVTYNVLCHLVLNWPGVELVTFVCCIYQHIRSSAWSVFLSPDGMTRDGMHHRRNYNIWFVHIITGSMLPSLWNVSVHHKY